jgi:uncharacterized protein
MADTHTHPDLSNDSQPLVSLIKFVGALLIAFSITYAFVFAFYFLRGINVVDLLQTSTGKSSIPNYKTELLILQGIFSVGLFILSSVIYIFLFERKPLSSLNADDHFSIVSLILPGFIIIAFMPLNSWLIDWNQNISFPSFMSDFEEWAKNKEASAEELTKLLIDIKTPADFVLTFIIVAVIAGIGEELLFRGVIQNKLFALFKNIHVAIWASAILFSAIHFQFYGFVPRMMLGVIFGYLYYWSNNIWVPIIAHFTNNGFTVLGMYMYNLKMLNYNIEDTAKAPLGMAISSLLITAGLMFSFWKYYTRKKLLQ